MPCAPRGVLHTAAGAVPRLGLRQRGDPAADDRLGVGGAGVQASLPKRDGAAGAGGGPVPRGYRARRDDRNAGRSAHCRRAGPGSGFLFSGHQRFNAVSSCVRPAIGASGKIPRHAPPGRAARGKAGGGRCPRGGHSHQYLRRPCGRSVTDTSLCRDGH